MGSSSHNGLGSPGKRLLLALAMLCLNGCVAKEFHHEPVPPIDPEQLLQPVTIKIHASSAVMVKAKGGKFDGLAVVCEVKDRFRDPVKTLGVVRFEVYAYARSQPENRGPRVGFWPNVNIDSLEAIQQYLDGFWGAYRLNLSWDRQVKAGERFELEITLITPEVKPLTDSRVLQASQ